MVDILCYHFKLSSSFCLVHLGYEANKFYDKGHQLYKAALLTRCYNQYALRPFINSEVNRGRYFIKIPATLQFMSNAITTLLGALSVFPLLLLLSLGDLEVAAPLRLIIC